MDRFVENLAASLHKGFIDRNYVKYGSYKPRLLVNNVKGNESVLSSMLEELSSCSTFIFIVAFITESGLATLKSHFLDLQFKGVKGRILTSTYLNFNQPKMYRELMKLRNVEVKLTSEEGFHAKGYIFDHSSQYSSLIVGSSNLTAQALKVNYEWNVKLTSHEDGEVIHLFKNQFEEVWSESEPLTEEWIYQYEKTYIKLSHRPPMENVAELPAQYQINPIRDALSIKPNKMQLAALQGLQSVRDNGKEKGLIISATGTGKTYLSAFDVRNFAPRRMLFIVHREQILNKAISDFKRVLGGYEKEFGILSGSSRQTEAKYLFATIQTLSKDETLFQFDRDAFDYILIDEVHKAGAKSYKKIIDYFKPQFFLGLTATPERTDDFNIFELFGYNVAYEIRLQEALEEDMLCPFHYFGVTDFEYNGEFIEDTTLLSKLVAKERITHITEKIQYYGFSGDQVKGLIFCSRKEEAVKLSILLNEQGYRTVALTGDHSQEERILRVNQLENGLLNYILTVDIFNEGIDIPSVNQVVMLRQTQSSIIFIQQLGRGLRKHNSKDYVTIIDFIGNYKNNYLIPIALSGDKSLNKDNIRRHTKDTSYIKGISTVNFEEIAKKQVFKAINNSNLSNVKLIREAFIELRNRIGRIPYLYDFVTNHSIDPVVIVDNSNYYQFLIKMKVEEHVLTPYEDNILTMLSMEILNGKREHEIILLDLMVNRGQVQYQEYLDVLQEANSRIDIGTLTSVHGILDLSFFTQGYKKKYGELSIVTLTKDKNYIFNDSVRASLDSNSYFKFMIMDIIQSAKEINSRYRCDNPLKLYEKYSRKDVCKLLNWKRDESSTIYGYKVKHQSCPIFITYHKKEEVESSVNYEDEFYSQEALKWYTRSRRTLESEEVRSIINAKQKGIAIHLFVKKDDAEGSDFYYLGEAVPDISSVEQSTMNDSKLSVVHMNMMMEHSIDSSLYHYLINE